MHGGGGGCMLMLQVNILLQCFQPHMQAFPMYNVQLAASIIHSNLLWRLVICHAGRHREGLSSEIRAKIRCDAS